MQLLTCIATLLFIAILQSYTTCYELVILHTNDIHAHFQEFSKYGGECTAKDKSKNECYGGYARQSTLVKELRKKYPNVILVSGGDFFQGTVWYYHWEGLGSAVVMDALNYTATCIGNHEYDKGMPKFIDNFLNKVKFPVLSANTLDANEPSMQGKYKRSTVVPVNGVKIGIIGYTTKDMPELSMGFGNLTFVDEPTAVKAEAKRLTDDGVKIIVAIGHAGMPTDKEILRQSSNVDVTVGGHDNTFLYNGPQPSVEKIQGPYPIVVNRMAGDRGIPGLAVQDFMFGKYLGVLKVNFDDNGVATNWSGNPILLDHTISEDPEMLKLLEPYKAEVDKLKSRIIAKSLVPLVMNGPEGLICRLKECNLGNLMADAVVDYYIDYDSPDGWAEVSLAVMNGGGMRSNINEENSGHIIYSQMLNAFPFGNTFDVVQLNGSIVYEMFEHSVANIEDIRGAFLQVSGFKVIYDLSKSPGNRVCSLLARCADCVIPKYEEVKPNKVYKVHVNSFMAKGGDGFTMIRDKNSGYIYRGDLDQDILIKYLERKSPVDIGLDNRITFQVCPVSMNILGHSSVLSSNTLLFTLIFIIHVLYKTI